MIAWRGQGQHCFDVLHPVVLGEKVINRNGRLTQLWFFIYITVGQQTATCFDRSDGQLQAVIYKRS
jgi:hypothetical protein